MILDPQVLSPGAMYQYMISLIVPRPIAFVSTLGADGRRNLAPFSYFVPLTNRPPLLGISIQKRDGVLKDTARNIEQTGEFVVNVVTEAMMEGMVLASGEWPPHVDEFEVTGFGAAPCERVRPPRVAESPAWFECRLHRMIELGDTTFVVGEILVGQVRDEVLDERRHVVPERLAALGRLGGEAYEPLREVRRLARPRVQRGG